MFMDVRDRENTRRDGVVRRKRPGGGEGAKPDRRPPVRPRERLGRDATDCRAQDAYLAAHTWDEYGEWHLGLTVGPGEETKARYAFVYGDFRRVHRSGLIACVYRAAEWRHKDVELAAHDLLQQLDRRRS